MGRQKGAIALAAVLKVNITLKELNIGHNPITSAGVIKILDAVESNPKSALENLNVEGLIADEPLLERLEAFHQAWNRSRMELTVDKFDITGLVQFKMERNKLKKIEQEKKAALEAEAK